MRKELFYLGLTLIFIMACVTMFFELNHPRDERENIQMDRMTFVERMDGGGTNESADIRAAQQADDTVLQQSVQAAKSFGANIKRDLIGEN